MLFIQMYCNSVFYLQNQKRVLLVSDDDNHMTVSKELSQGTKETVKKKRFISHLSFLRSAECSRILKLVLFLF